MSNSTSPLWRAAFVHKLNEDNAPGGAKDAGKLSLSLEKLEVGADKATKECKLMRSPKEDISKTLGRLAKTLSKGREEPVNTCMVELHESGQIDHGLTAQRALMEKGAAIVINGKERFTLCVDNPRVHDIKMRGLPMVNCPIAPWPETEMVEDQNILRWKWTYADEEDVSKAEALSTSRIYSPREEDIGRKLRVTCTVDSEFPDPVSVSMENAVLASPPEKEVLGRLPRHSTDANLGSESSGSSKEANHVRVMTYNTLADAYSHTWDEMYAYCDPKHRDIEYRAPLLAREIRHYAADILCLQEVDTKMEEFWKAQLEEDFICFYTPKDGAGMEGCLMAVRKSRFKIESFESISFRDLVERRRKDATWLNHLLTNVESLEHSISRVTSIAQFAVLRLINPEEGNRAESTEIGNKTSVSSEFGRVIVTNTHSFFHPGAGNIRCIQAKLLADLVEAKRQDDDAVIMCGDWNAQSYDLSLQFLLYGKVAADHPEWATSSIFKYESKANLARDVIYEDAGSESQRYMDILTQTSPSGRALSVEQLRKQVEEIDKSYSLVDKLNVVAELKRGLSWHDDPVDQVAIRDMISLMQSHLQESKAQLVATQRAKTEAIGDAYPNTGVGCGAHLSHDLDLFSVYGEPKFTNYVGNWYGDLDWILCSRDTVEVQSLAPIPEESTLQQDTALPSKEFPSDHVSLCADLKLRKSRV